MDLCIRLGRRADIDALERLYDAVNEHLASTINYPGWRKGIYPVRDTAVQGIQEGCLYVAVVSEKVVGSIILRHEPEPAYREVKWRAELPDEAVLVIYTLAVHPEYLSRGIGHALLDFAADFGLRTHIKSLRLDVYEKNLPAIRLYEKCGFQYITTVDLGLGVHGLNWFKLYEKWIT